MNAQATNADRLEYAKKHYPKGTKFKSASPRLGEGSRVYKVIGDPILLGSDIIVSVAGNTPLAKKTLFSFHTNKWAEVVEETLRKVAVVGSGSIGNQGILAKALAQTDECVENSLISEDYPEYTIQDLADGKVACINDGTVEELNRVLKAAFPKSTRHVHGDSKIYLKDTAADGYWMGSIEKTNLPTQSVKAFIKQLEGEVQQYWKIKDKCEGENYSTVCIKGVVREFSQGEMYYSALKTSRNIIEEIRIGKHTNNGRTILHGRIGSDEVCFDMEALEPSTKQAYEAQFIDTSQLAREFAGHTLNHQVDHIVDKMRQGIDNLLQIKELSPEQQKEFKSLWQNAHQEGTWIPLKKETKVLYLNEEDRPRVEARLDFDGWLRAEQKEYMYSLVGSINWNFLLKKYEDHCKATRDYEPIEFDPEVMCNPTDFDFIEYRGEGVFFCWNKDWPTHKIEIVQGTLNSGML